MVLCNITISLKCFNIKFHPIPDVKKVYVKYPVASPVQALKS